MVIESAVVGYPHQIKGQGIYAFVICNKSSKNKEDIETEIKGLVRKIIGPIAKPDYVQIVPGLPKTRSGKIMRRILRKIAANEHDQLGDITTLADQSVVKNLIENRQKVGFDSDINGRSIVAEGSSSDNNLRN